MLSAPYLARQSVAGLSLLRQTPVALTAPVTPARGPWAGVSGGDTPTIKLEKWRRAKKATAARIDCGAELLKEETNSPKREESIFIPSLTYLSRFYRPVKPSAVRTIQSMSDVACNVLQSWLVTSSIVICNAPWTWLRWRRAVGFALRSDLLVGQMLIREHT